MKVCIKCELPREDEEFPLRNKRTGKRNNTCNECHRKYLKWHYSNNRQKYIDKAHVFNKQHRKQNALRLVEFLRGKGCSKCGETDLRVLDFDHRDRETKRHGIAKMINTQHWNSILKEIEKCDILCANCHRKRTAKQFGWTKHLVQENLLQDRVLVNSPVS